MKQPIAFLGAVLAIVLAGSPVLAQYEKPTGSRIGRPSPADIPDDKMSDIDRARLTTDNFAQCVLLHDAKKVEAVLALPTGQAGSSALGKLATDDCLREGELRMPTELLRGSIFRALYRRDFEHRAPPFAEKPFDFASLVPDTTSPENDRFVLLGDFADCVVRADPQDSRSLILSRPGDARENTSFAAISAQLGPCFPRGLAVKFNRAMIVGLIAEALYRETKAGVGAAHG